MKGTGWLVRRPAGGSPEGLRIPASEVRGYLYCARGWWLERTGRAKPDAARCAAGEAAHDRSGEPFRAGAAAAGEEAWGRWIAGVLLVVGLVLLVWALNH